MKVPVCFSILLVFLLYTNTSYSQKEKLHLGFYAKGIWLKKDYNKKQLVFKEGIEDGVYLITTKKFGQGDTIMIGHIKNGLLNGVLKRWDLKDHYLEEECEYKDGEINGYSKLYFKSKEGVIYTNIYRYINNAVDEENQIEW